MSDRDARIEFYVLQEWNLEEATRIVEVGLRAGPVDDQPNTEAENEEAGRIYRQQEYKRRLRDK